jgi:4-hydroxybenzoyl-CoA thioesterase
MAVQCTRKIDFPMIDLAGIAYYPRIYDLCHRLFEDAWEQFTSYNYQQILDDIGVGFPIKHIESEFHAPIRYGDIITIEISMSKIGSSSCVWEYSMTNQLGTMVWSSSQTTVCVNMITIQPVAIPEELRLAMVEHLLVE